MNHESLEATGVLNESQLRETPGYPEDADLDNGPTVVIECAELIPCDPCQYVCPHDAIFVGQPITRLPKVDHSRCIGCGLCIPTCPGLAIFVVNKHYSDTTGTVSLPYELHPLPKAGEVVAAADRSGQYVCDARVISAPCPASFHKTAVVTLEVPKEEIMTVRGLHRAQNERFGSDSIDSDKAIGKDVIICRCEEVTYGEILDAIEHGCRTPDEIKRWTRAGMGLCQSRSCGTIVRRILASVLGVSPEELSANSDRPPTAPVALRSFSTLDPAILPEGKTEWSEYLEED